MKKKVVFVLTALVIIALPLLIFNQEPLQDVKISADPTLAAAELVTSTPVPPQKTENTPQPTPANQPVKEVAVSNPSELFQNMISGRHIRLVPDGNYDLTTVFSSVKSFEALHDLTLEGVGDKPVVLYSENVNSSVLAFTDCTNITLKNLELSHEGMNFDEHEGKLLCFYGENENITIKNCIISGEGAAGLFASGINNLSMEDTLIHVNYPAAMELGKVNNAAFNRCTFYSYQIEVRDSEGVRFDDCLFSSLEIKDRGWRLFEEPADYVVSKYVNMECENNGILVRNSLFGDSEDTELLKDNLLARLPETPCSFDITWDEITGHVVISLKAPVPPQEGQKGYQEYFEKVLSCFEGFSLPEEDMKILGFDMPPQMDMLLELGVIYTRYNKFDELLERYRNGEKVSFRETDFIHYGDMDTGLLNSANKQYLSAQQACDIFLKELPLPVSAKDYEPFFPLSGVETGTPTLIEEDGRLFYMFKDLRYGGTESFGFDGFCVDAATGSLNKYDGKQYVEVSSADKLLIADIVRHLEKNGTIISEEDWMKVQIYDQKHISVYISGKLYFRLKLSKTAEGNQLKLYEPKYQTEGDVSEAFLEPPCREDVRWDDTYDLQWKFSEETDEALYYYVDEIVGNTVLVKGHDGGTSGCHQYTYLYGLDLGTGQKIWSVDGDYMGIYCGVTDDLEKAYTVTNGNKGLDWFKLIDIDAGILWEKDVTEYSFFCTGDYWKRLHESTPFFDHIIALSETITVTTL